MDPLSDADLGFHSHQPDNRFVLRDHGYRAGASCGVHVYLSWLVLIEPRYFDYLHRDGQAELTGMADYIPTLFTCPQTVICPSAQSRVVETNALLPVPNHQ